MHTVNHEITIGTAVFTPTDHTRLIDLQVKASLDVPVNSSQIVMSLPADLNPAPADNVTVSLGYEDDLSLAFTGVVCDIKWGIDRVQVQALGSFQSLLSARFNYLYEKLKAGDIVFDVASQLGISIGNVESGLEFLTYALGENQPIYNHLQYLAQQCGYDLYANADDELIFAAFQPITTHAFAYGTNILALTLDEPTTSMTGVEVYGESPASHGQGADAHTWLTKKEVNGVAGDTDGVVMRVADPTVRTVETAVQMAESLLTTTSRKQRTQIKVLGNAHVKLGDAVEISAMPTDKQNGTFKVTGIQHRLTGRRGFVTTIEGEAI